MLGDSAVVPTRGQQGRDPYVHIPFLHTCCPASTRSSPSKKDVSIIHSPLNQGRGANPRPSITPLFIYTTYPKIY